MLEMLMNLDTKEEGVRTLVRLMVAGILADFLSERFQVRTGAWVWRQGDVVNEVVGQL